VSEPANALPVVHALIWRARASDAEWDPSEFDARIPRLMEWLSRLRAEGRLVACGGGGFEDRAGGLTLVRADSPEQALEIAAGSPMNEIGTTELLVWDVYYGELHHPREFPAPGGGAA